MHNRVEKQEQPEAWLFDQWQAIYLENPDQSPAAATALLRYACNRCIQFSEVKWPLVVSWLLEVAHASPSGAEDEPSVLLHLLKLTHMGVGVLRLNEILEQLLEAGAHFSRLDSPEALVHTFLSTPSSTLEKLSSKCLTTMDANDVNREGDSLLHLVVRQAGHAIGRSYEMNKEKENILKALRVCHALGASVLKENHRGELPSDVLKARRSLIAASSPHHDGPLTDALLASLDEMLALLKSFEPQPSFRDIMLMREVLGHVPNNRKRLLPEF